MATVSARIGWKALTADEYVDQGYAFLSTPNIKSAEIDFVAVNRITGFRYDESPDLKLQVGDVLLAKDGSTLGIANVVRALPEPATVNGSIAVIRPSRSLDGVYLRYVLAGARIQEQIGLLKNGMGVPHLFQWDINRFSIPCPPMAEQRRIADFLDAQVARIDEVVRLREEQVAALPMRHAAYVETLLAPLDWVVPLRSRASLVQTGPFGSQLKSDEYVDDGIPVINPSHLVGGEIRPDSRVAVTPEKAHSLGRHALRQGDLVLARRGELGRCAVVDEQSVGMLCGTGSALVRPRTELMLPDFMAVAFSSRRNREALSLASVGSTMDNLNADIVAALRVPDVPVSMQERILDLTTADAVTTSNVVMAMRSQIDLMQERKRSLITAAVTGELDVTTAGAA